MQKLLLVEDEEEIRQIERDYLVREGFQVDEAGSGFDALEKFAKNAYDAVVLDLNLPGVDGLAVCREIRLTSHIPIMMVTAKTGEIDELLGLEIGADDYLKKPFSPKILVARVKTLLKRPVTGLSKKRLALKDVVLDIDKKQLFKKGHTVNLTSTQFNMVMLLMQHPGKVFDREELISKGYGKIMPPDIYDRTIDSHIKNIRKALEDDPKHPQLLLTVRGHGYKLNPDE